MLVSRTYRLVVTLLLCSIAIFAQSTAQINGSVKDDSGAAVPGVEIKATHTATGAVRTATLMHGLRRRKLRYGMVSMCIGTGMGAAGVFESL